MTWSPKLLGLVFAGVVTALPVAAEVRGFQVRDGQCFPEPPSDAEPGKVVVVIVPAAGVTLSDWTLSVKVSDSAVRSEPFKGTPLAASLTLSSTEADGLISAKGKANGTDVPCAAFKAATATPPANPTAGKPADLSLDREAASWFASTDGATAVNVLKQQIKTRLDVKEIELLPHLPSGALAGPYPASIAETTDLVTVVIVDLNERKLRTLRITDVVCPERDGFRILGDLKAFIGQGQARSTDERKFALLPTGQLLECGAGYMKYTAQMHVDGIAAGDPIPAQVRLRAIYQLAATAAVGFDTTRPPTAYPVVDGKVTETRTRIGTELYVGFVWYPTGIDYERVTRANRIAPFVLFDPEALKDHFVVGGAITAKGRISIPIGLSVHRFDVPDGTSVGASFSGDGAVKTRKDFGKKGLGLFVGVSFNVAEFLRVKNALTPAK